MFHYRLCTCCSCRGINFEQGGSTGGNSALSQKAGGGVDTKMKCLQDLVSGQLPFSSSVWMGRLNRWHRRLVSEDMKSYVKIFILRMGTKN